MVGRYSRTGATDSGPDWTLLTPPLNNAECEVVQVNLLVLVVSYNDRSGDMLLQMQVSLVVDLIQEEHGVAEYRYGALMAS